MFPNILQKLSGFYFTNMTCVTANKIDYLLRSINHKHYRITFLFPVSFFFSMQKQKVFKVMTSRPAPKITSTVMIQRNIYNTFTF